MFPGLAALHRYLHEGLLVGCARRIYGVAAISRQIALSTRLGMAPDSHRLLRDPRIAKPAEHGSISHETKPIVIGGGRASGA